jgi:iron(III) transport system substrate-binding protein
LQRRPIRHIHGDRAGWSNPVDQIPSRALTSLAAAALLFASGCTRGPEESRPTLTVYSGRTEALVAPVVAAFEKETGIEARVSYADTSQLAATILEEGAQSPADVFFAQDAATMELLRAEGRLSPLPISVLEQVAERYRDPAGSWVGTSGRSRVLAYHPNRVRPEDLPASLDELTGEAWKGRVGWAPTNASFQSFLALMVRERGEEATLAWLRAMRANGARDYPSNVPAVQAVASGEIDVALTNHYYVHRLRAEQGSSFIVRNHYLNSADAASQMNVSAAGILATSGNRQAAESFVAFLLSSPAQAHFAAENFEFPLAAGVRPSPELPALGDLRVPATNSGRVEDLATGIRLLRTAGVTP